MTAVPQEKAAQLDAIEESGWGRPYRFLQPHNVAFWVYVAGVGAGALTMLRVFGPGAQFYTPALAGGVVLFGLYLIPWLLLLRHHNRFTAQPAALLATGFVWGGVAATFWIALPANAALLAIWAKVGGTSFAADWGAGLTAPVNEEFAKAIGLVLLIGLAPRLIRSAYDGFIIGAFIGLGFQVFEDILYVYNGATQQYGVDQLGSSLRVFIARLVQRDLLRRPDVGTGPHPRRTQGSTRRPDHADGNVLPLRLGRHGRPQQRRRLGRHPPVPDRRRGTDRPLLRTPPRRRARTHLDPRTPHP
jgi:hypothetical protein